MPKILDSIKKIFGRKSKETETTPEIITMEGNLEKLEKEVGKSVELSKKQGDVKTAKKLKDIARKLKKAPNEAVKELEAFLEKTNLSPKTKQKLQALLEKFKGSFKSLLNAISVRKKHNEHVEKVTLSFYEMVNEILKKEFKFCNYGKSSERVFVSPKDVTDYILEAMDTSGMNGYARKLRKSVVNKWCEYLSKEMKEIDMWLEREFTDLMRSSNRDKEKLVNPLCDIQYRLCVKLLGILNLEQYCCKA